MPADPWKRADKESLKEASSSNGFPPLNAQGLSKAQRRARALYTQSSVTFEPYPPRIENLNRQELNRRLLVEENDESRDLEEEESVLDHRSTLQKNGISSVTIYNKDGEKLSSGPDIYRRSKPIKTSHEKGKDRLAVSQKEPRREEEYTATLPLPTPFTDKKLDKLMQECGRLERVHAIEDRTYTQGDSTRESAYDPLKQELLKAFSSIDGFLAAFGKEQINSESN